MVSATAKVVLSVLLLLLLVGVGVGIYFLATTPAAAAPSENPPPPPPPPTPEQPAANHFSNGDKLRLSTWIGPQLNGFVGWATTCDQCNASQDDLLAISRNKVANGVFTVETVDDVENAVHLKAADGTYLGQSTLSAQNAGQHGLDYVMKGHADANSETQLTVEKLSDTVYTFQFDNGKYLSVCNGCASQITAEGLNPWNNGVVSDTAKNWTVELL